MTTLKRLAATALSAAVLTAPLLTVSTAEAAPERAGMKWSKIGTFGGATQQACKKSIKGGDAWRVYTRVVTGKYPVGVGLFVKKGDKVKKEFRTPITAKHKTSKAGSVVLPRTAGFTLEAFQFEGQSGSGGPMKIKKIRVC